MTSKMHYKWFKKGPCHITLERRDTSLFTRDSSEPTKQYLGLEQYLNGLVKTFLSFSFKHHGVSNGVDLKWITMIKNRSYVNTENQENFLWITKLEGLFVYSLLIFLCQTWKDYILFATFSFQKNKSWLNLIQEFGIEICFWLLVKYFRSKANNIYY